MKGSNNNIVSERTKSSSNNNIVSERMKRSSNNIVSERTKRSSNNIKTYENFECKQDNAAPVRRAKNALAMISNDVLRSMKEVNDILN